MFIPKGYALSNEIAQKAGISIANFSMLRKDFEDRNIDGVVKKIGNCTFVNTESPMLPKYIKKALDFKYTPLDNLILISYLISEFKIKREDILKVFKPYDGKIVTIAGKKFLKVNDEFYNKLKGKVVTNIKKKDALQCLEDGDIEGYLELSSNNYLVWYEF